LTRVFQRPEDSLLYLSIDISLVLLGKRPLPQMLTQVNHNLLSTSLCDGNTRSQSNRDTGSEPLSFMTQRHVSASLPSMLLMPARIRKPRKKKFGKRPIRTGPVSQSIRRWGGPTAGDTTQQPTPWDRRSASLSRAVAGPVSGVEADPALPVDAIARPVASDDFRTSLQATSGSARIG